MTSNQVITLIVSFLVGGGLFAGIGALIGARAQVRKVQIEEERAPAETQSIWLGGAEKAVVALQQALDRMSVEITRLESALDAERQRSEAKDQRIAKLEHRLSVMREQLNRLQWQADQLGVDIGDLRRPEGSNDVADDQ